MAESLRDKRFKSDEVFNYINKNFVSLKDEDMKKYSEHLEYVVGRLITYMRNEDRLFNSTYQRIAYAGSYYDGLKVGKPDEFDLNVVINPAAIIKDSVRFHPVDSRPGYVKIKVDNRIMNPESATLIRAIESFGKYLDKDNYLCQDIFRRWIEGVIDKAINALPPPSGNKVYMVSKKKSGPAFTINILVPEGYQIDVDLVPVIEFKCAALKEFRPADDYQGRNWLAVAKPLDGDDARISWRLSFYEQERELIKGPVKPVIRQMKKMRGTQKFDNLASYYIKTLFLWELESHKDDPEFSMMSQTCLFVNMLRKLCEACEGRGRGISNFWCQRQNLLIKLSPVERENIYYRLKRMIQSIDRQITDNPFIIARYILTDDEFKQMNKYFPRPLPTTSSSVQTSARHFASF